MADERRPPATYDDWGPYWEAIDIDRSGMLAFYRRLITNDTRSLVELACGTGTMTVPLAEELFRYRGDARVVGVDQSVGMLQAARARDRRIEWILGDIRRPPVESGFDLVISCFNVLQELINDDDLLQTFTSVRRLLNSGGSYAFDIYQPNAEWLASPETNRLARTGTDKLGRRLEVREDTRYDPASRVVTFDWRLVEAGRDALPPLARMRYYVRQYYSADIDRLLAAAGLKVCQRYGDFDNSPFTGDSKKQILICAPAE